MLPPTCHVFSRNGVLPGVGKLAQETVLFQLLSGAL